jgi:hypothetical protein
MMRQSAVLADSMLQVVTGVVIPEVHCSWLSGLGTFIKLSYLFFTGLFICLFVCLYVLCGRFDAGLCENVLIIRHIQVYLSESPTITGYGQEKASADIDPPLPLSNHKPTVIVFNSVVTLPRSSSRVARCRRLSFDINTFYTACIMADSSNQKLGAISAILILPFNSSISLLYR